jgi:uncharacterized protein
MLTQFVIKVSKLCNLRCSYCYEMPELGNPDRMSLGDVSRMFGNMAAFYRGHPDAEIRCIWHGGEPLLQEPDYYRAIFAEQARHGVRFSNVMQTNLTMLDDDRIALLRDHFRGQIGVSLDLFGDLRLNVAGRSSQSKVLANLDRLHEAGIRFGCITVLTRRNLRRVDDIFRFYERLGVPFRLLPLFRGATESQHAGYELSERETLDALCRLFDRWLASETRIAIQPISALLAGILRRRRGREDVYYDRRAWEEVVLVNTNGDLYAQGDAYLAGASWGNIFTTSLTELMVGEARARSVLAGETRMAASCASCEYLGACNGFAMAEDNRVNAASQPDHDGRCVVERGLCAHIDRRLVEADERFGPTFATMGPIEAVEGVAL